MLARYASVLNRLDHPAVLIRLARQQFAIEPNALAMGFSADSTVVENLCTAAALVFGDGEIRRVVIDSTVFSVAPLFDESSSVEAVVAVPIPVERLAQFLDRMQHPMRHFAQIIHLLPSAVAVARADGEVDYLSRRWYDLIGASPMALAPQFAFESAFADKRVALAQWRSSIRRGRPFDFEVPIATPGGERWHLLSATASIDRGRILRWVASISDVHEGRIARGKLERSERRLRILALCARLIEVAASIDEIAAQIVRVPLGGGDESWIVELGDRFARRVHRGISVSDDDVAMLEHALYAERASGTQVRLTSGHERHIIAARLPGADDLGYVAIAGPASGDAAEWLALMLGELAQHLATVFEQRAIAEREREVATTLQRAMLPIALPSVPGIRLDVHYSPAARDNLVGGDWYDVFPFDDGCLGITIGDIAGHGLDAAIVMGHVRQHVRAASREDVDPASVLESANRMLIRESRTFASAFFAVLDPLTLEFRYAGAGHPPPLLVHDDEALISLEPTGALLGVRKRCGARSQKLVLPRNSALVLYTDGVVESGRNIVKGEAKLAEAVRAWARTGYALRASQLQHAVIGGAEQNDDAAMLVVRIAPPEDPLETTIRATKYDAARMRHLAIRYFANIGLDEQQTFDAVLALSEAVNNAVEHAYADDRGEVRIVLRRYDDRIAATVSDHGKWKSKSGDPDRGRGLAIMRRLVPELTIDSGDDGTHVRFAIAIDSTSFAKTK